MDVLAVEVASQVGIMEAVILRIDQKAPGVTEVKLTFGLNQLGDHKLSQIDSSNITHFITSRWLADSGFDC